MSIKIAAVTDDGATLSEHFGQATRYVVMTVVDGRITHREERAKPACDHRHGSVEHEHHHDDVPMVSGASAVEGPDLHTRMTDVIADCDAVIARCVPRPMFNHLVSAGIRPLITSIDTIDDALDAYLAAEPE